MYVDVLPRWERSIYWICSIASISYCISCVFEDGEKNKDAIAVGLTPGWSWIGREKDITHYALRIWLNTLWIAMPWNVIHILLSQACWYFQLNCQIRQLLLTVVDVSGLCLVFGTRAVILLLALASIMYMISLQGRVSLVWLLAIIVMFSRLCIGYFALEIVLLEFLSGFMPNQYRISVSAFCLKLVSVGVEKIKYREYQTSTQNTDSDKSGELNVSSNSNSNQTTHLSNRNSDNGINVQPSASEYVHLNTVDSDPSYFDFLFYLFYNPTFFWGPFYDYCSFHNEVKTSFKSFIITEKVRNIIKQLIKLTFCLVVVDFHFHFLYYKVLAYDHALLEGMSDWTLLGIAYCQCCYFNVQYFIIYGYGIQLSRFDGVAALPAPRCFHLIFSCTDLWKYFDVGLYTFLKKYIFIPVGGSKRGLPRQLMASGLCFLFIIFWHGAKGSIVVWGVGNYFTWVLESSAFSLDKSEIGVKMKSKLGPAMMLRMKALLYYLAYMTSWFMAFYFFFGVKGAWIMISKLTLQASWLSLATQCFLITSNIHISIYMKELYKDMDKQNVK